MRGSEKCPLRWIWSALLQRRPYAHRGMADPQSIFRDGLNHTVRSGKLGTIIRRYAHKEQSSDRGPPEFETASRIGR